MNVCPWLRPGVCSSGALVVQGSAVGARVPPSRSPTGLPPLFLWSPPSATLPSARPSPFRLTWAGGVFSIHLANLEQVPALGTGVAACTHLHFPYLLLSELLKRML